MEFDEQKKLIIKALIKDPRMSDNNIGKLTKVPIRTVSRKRKKLGQNNEISYYVSTNPKSNSVVSKSLVSQSRLLAMPESKDNPIGLKPKPSLLGHTKRTLTLIPLLTSWQLAFY